MYKHILVPIDGSKLALKAAKEAAALAKNLKARITALYVIAPFMPRASDGYISPFNGALARRYKEATQKVAAQALEKVGKAAAGVKVRCDQVAVTNDQPWAGIVKAARDRKCDVIVMGSHGRGGLASLLLGSETQKVLAHSKTPVLVCR